LNNWPQREGRKKQTITVQRVRRNFDLLASKRGKKEADYYRE
jgi:hypothetical protein